MKNHLLHVELGLTLDFDIAAELARIDAKKRRRPARMALRDALRKQIHAALGAEQDAATGGTRGSRQRC